MIWTNGVIWRPGEASPRLSISHNEGTSMAEMRINGEQRRFEADPDMPMLWAVRDLLG